jgi:hypothetical protein
MGLRSFHKKRIEEGRRGNEAFAFGASRGEEEEGMDEKC